MKASESIEQMTLLDHFAGQIAASMVNAAILGSRDMDEDELGRFVEVMSAIPHDAYAMAFAMLVERARRMNAQENPQ